MLLCSAQIVEKHQTFRRKQTKELEHDYISTFWTGHCTILQSVRFLIFNF